MNLRPPSRPGAFWRERFVAIALEAQASAPRPHAGGGARIRPRLAGAAAERRFGAASPRF
ncbi:MAG TPA: hypothetical protein VEG27_12315 [Usitatibacter sp.]|nr:hypothetical protein [Usitatibacter sp.]